MATYGKGLCVNVVITSAVSWRCANTAWMFPHVREILVNRTEVDTGCEKYNWTTDLLWTVVLLI